MVRRLVLVSTRRTNTGVMRSTRPCALPEHEACHGAARPIRGSQASVWRPPGRKFPTARKIPQRGVTRPWSGTVPCAAQEPVRVMPKRAPSGEASASFLPFSIGGFGVTASSRKPERSKP